MDYYDSLPLAIKLAREAVKDSVPIEAKPMTEEDLIWLAGIKDHTLKYYLWGNNYKLSDDSSDINP
jgi:hypothetical protein